MQAQVQAYTGKPVTGNMEDAMPTIRIVAAGAFLLSLPLVAGGTMAQAAVGAEPGKPLQLVQLANAPGKAKTKPHMHTAHHRGKVHFAAAKAHMIHPDETAEAAKAAPAADAPPANVWPERPDRPGADERCSGPHDAGAAGGRARAERTRGRRTHGGRGRSGPGQ